MDDIVVSPAVDTHQNTLSAQLHIVEIDNSIYDPHSPIAETGTPRASHHTRDPTTDAALLKAYWNTAWFAWGFAWVFTMALMAYVSLNYSRDDTIIQASISHMPYYYAWFFVVYLVITACGGARINRWAVGLLLISTLPFIGMVILASKRGDDNYDGGHSAVWLTLWLTGILPTSPLVCKQRLEKKQHILLSTDYYSAQFARAVIHNASGGRPIFVSHAFNETRFLEVHNNADICYQGFEGNPDLYGLGVRLCIYLQWIIALITNNLLPHARQTYRAAWLVFSTGMCIVAFVASIADYCVFGIEIEILYWMYWGGFACVYASAPSHIRLEGQANQVGILDWKTAILCTLHISMAYHGLWFSWWGYDQVFARMPCGTYQFMFAKFLDPSTPYCYARDVLSVAFNMTATPLLLVIPVAIVVMAVEIKASVQGSAVYHMFFRPRTGQALGNSRQRIQERNDIMPNRDESERRATSLLTRVRQRFLNTTRIAYYFLRWLAGLPRHRLGGIRLITPVDVQQRRSYRIRCLVVWLVSFSISVTAIETTLSWNRVTSVHSLTSLGQILSLAIGTATFMSVIWELFKEESKRRQDAKRRRVTADDTLPPLPLTLSGAIRSAFRQLDHPFLTNAVALPSFTTNHPDSDALSDNDPYMMGGDNETGTQTIDTTSEIESSTETD